MGESCRDVPLEAEYFSYIPVNKETHVLTWLLNSFKPWHLSFLRAPTHKDTKWPCKKRADLLKTD